MNHEYITLYDPCSLQSCGAFKYHLWPNGKLSISGVGDTVTEGARMRVTSATHPARLPGYALLCCACSDGVTRLYALPALVWAEMAQSDAAQAVTR